MSKGGKKMAIVPLTEFLELRARFEIFLTLKGRAKRTVDSHSGVARRITSQIGSIRPAPEAVDLFVFETYRAQRSFSHKVNTVKTLEYWLEFIGQPRKFGRPKKPRRVITGALSEAEINRLFFVARSLKEKAVLALLAYGLRPNEVCSVRHRDLDLARQTVFIREGKGMKDALVTLPAPAVDILMQYLAEAPRQSDDWLLTTYQGNRYTTGAARKLIKVLARLAGIERRVWPYQMRHSYATNLVIRGANLEYIRQQMRHAWMETTMTYLSSVPHLGSVEHLHPNYF